MFVRATALPRDVLGTESVNELFYCNDSSDSTHQKQLLIPSLIDWTRSSKGSHVGALTRAPGQHCITPEVIQQRNKERGRWARR